MCDATLISTHDRRKYFRIHFKVIDTVHCEHQLAPKPVAGPGAQCCSRLHPPTTIWPVWTGPASCQSLDALHGYL